MKSNAFKNHVYAMKNRNIQKYAVHVKKRQNCKIKLCISGLLTIIQTCRLSIDTFCTV